MVGRNMQIQALRNRGGEDAHCPSFKVKKDWPEHGNQGLREMTLIRAIHVVRVGRCRQSSTDVDRGVAGALGLVTLWKTVSFGYVRSLCLNLWLTCLHFSQKLVLFFFILFTLTEETWQAHLGCVRWLDSNKQRDVGFFDFVLKSIFVVSGHRQEGCSDQNLS